MIVDTPETFGRLNGHAVGIILKELVRRAIEAIRVARFAFEVSEKDTGYSDLKDIVTTADKVAQSIYLRGLRECFPDFGIVAEEDKLAIRCAVPGHNYYFSVDPLDGTKAFARRQSFGVGTMLGLVCDGQVVSAYVGDVMTQEIFGFRPGSDKVHRISEYGRAEPLDVPEGEPEFRQNVLLLRELPQRHSPLIQRLVDAPNSLFAKAEVMSGSIGIYLARLWKREVRAAAWLPGMDTPWDTIPLIGISQQLGFVFLKVCGDQLEAYQPQPVDKVVQRDFEVLVIHRSQLADLAQRFGILKV